MLPIRLLEQTTAAALRDEVSCIPSRMSDVHVPVLYSLKGFCLYWQKIELKHFEMKVCPLHITRNRAISNSQTYCDPYTVKEW